MQCPYHGWEYDLNGTFRGATQMQGIKNFYAADQALWPIRLDTFGPLMFLLFSNDECAPHLLLSCLLRVGGLGET